MNFKWIAIPFILALLASKCDKDNGEIKDNTMKKKYTNALINETSPYLLQHAHNPVDWMPFSNEAFEKAEKEDKLVLVSVGYSACHWCHVMEHETFEDSIAAEYMNDHFICIKVDREERPDVDQVYMNAVQLMTRSGGWPLNCFTLPDARPIYGGTYFPKQKWMDVMESLVEMKQRDPNKLIEYASNLTAGIQSSEMVVKVEEEVEFELESVDMLVQDWAKYWDFAQGGAKRAPKFPMPNNYEFLLRYGHLKEDNKTQEFVELTLDKIYQGGIYDQIGGGFARYSTDMDWKVPHFEKMLYDNAQLVSLYSEAYVATKNPEYRRAVEETLEFVKRELTGPVGEFYSALDADSEREEGKFYIWSKAELQSILEDDLFDFVKDYYNINAKGKWENDNYILLRSQSLENYAKANKLEVSEIENNLKLVKEALMNVRDTRVRPGLDDKSLTSWNALMVKGYADAYKNLGTKEYLNIAIRNANFIWDTQRKNGALFHSYKEGRSTINGYLEDYCFTIEAYVALYEATFDEAWLSKADELMQYAITHFYDETSGMFWFTSDLDPPLIARKMEVEDNVIPSSNSSTAKGLFLLGTYLYKESYLDLSNQMLKNVIPDMQYGQGYSNWNELMLWHTFPFFEVAITGKGNENLRNAFSQNYIPNKILMGGESKSSLPLLENKFLGEPTIFVCVNKSCQLPVDNVADALDQIKMITE